MKLIPLTQGKFAQLDDADFEFLSQFIWHARKDLHCWYAGRNIPGEDGTQSSVLMHRVIADAPAGVLVDHWDGDGLNNQRLNLRCCTHSQNNKNKHKAAPATSKFKGVYWKRASSKWESSICVDYKRKYLGLFLDEQDAARAYDSAAQQHFGEFAALNFPQEVQCSAMR